MKSLKGVLIILDGLGDRPVAALRHRTPLAAAQTPCFDALAARGVCGLMYPLMPWVPVGTHVGVGLLMGLPPSNVNRLRRGPIEAAGVGLHVQPGDVALRCNFATVEQDDGGLRLLDRRAGRVVDGRADLADAINAIDYGVPLSVRFAPTTGHRGALVLSGEGLSGAITDTDPGAHQPKGTVQACRAVHDAGAEEEAAQRTAGYLNAVLEQIHHVLADHPVNARRRAAGRPMANALITRGAGRAEQLRNQLAHMGLRVALVTGERTAAGLARLFGFTVLQEPSFTGTPHTNLAGKVKAVQAAVATHDLVFLHVKAPDVFSHDHDGPGKKAFLEQLDRALAPLFSTELVVAVTGDHSTDTTLGRHIGDPVPTVLAAPHIRKDEVKAFHEGACGRGGLGHLSANALLFAVLDHMNRLGNYRPYQYLV